MGKWLTQFTAGFLGGFSGKIVAAIVIAGCIAVGLGGPPNWFDWLANNQNLLRWIAVLAAFAVGFIWFWYLPRHSRKIPIAISRIESRAQGYAGFFDEKEKDAWQLLFGDSSSLVTITNISTTKHITLDIWLHVIGDNIRNVKFLADLQGPFGLILGKDDATAKSFQKLERDPMQYFKCPVTLQPQETTRRRLEFLQNYDSPIRDLLFAGMGKGLRYELEIFDHVSGGTVRFSIPGEYRA